MAEHVKESSKITMFHWKKQNEYILISYFHWTTFGLLELLHCVPIVVAKRHAQPNNVDMVINTN